jgi:hypothetical protein
MEQIVWQKGFIGPAIVALDGVMNFLFVFKKLRKTLKAI